MENYYLTKENFHTFLLRLGEKNIVYFPCIEEGKVHFHRFRAEDETPPALESIRASEPIKHFFLGSKERVAAFAAPLEKETPSTVIIGVKACDLRALEVYDRVFLQGEFTDPFYKERREKTLLISTDCPQPESTCFCNLLGLKPYAEEGSDLNMSVAERGYILTVLSDKGSQVIRENEDLFTTVASEELAFRDRRRTEAMETLSKTNPQSFKEDLAERVNGAKDREFWASAAAGCVECFSCLYICPTCYCFLLYDQEDERVRVWDACYYAAYARVGGGLNPRPEFLKRFKNRFECKFLYFYKYHNFFACSGCGRCIKGCSANIDIREILWKL